jgi:hypothetical protein
MSNRPRTGIVRSTLAQGFLIVFLGMTLGCSASSPSGPTPTPVTTATSPPAPVSAYTVTAGTNMVAPGDQLSVSWTASPAYYADWISLFKVGQPNSPPVWVESTEGATSGTFTLSAPIQAGQYEFRYLLEDEHDVARSSLVTVGTVPK